MLQDLFDDLRYGLRVLRKSPGPSAVAILTLALGIAANTAVFGWINSLLLHPLPGGEAFNELAAIETITPSGDFNVSSFQDYRFFRDHSTFGSGLAASLVNAFNVGDDQRPARVWGEHVTSNYFSVLCVKARSGRAFTQTSSATMRVPTHM